MHHIAVMRFPLPDAARLTAHHNGRAYCTLTNAIPTHTHLTPHASPKSLPMCAALAINQRNKSMSDQPSTSCKSQTERANLAESMWLCVTTQGKRPPHFLHLHLPCALMNCFGLQLRLSPLLVCSGSASKPQRTNKKHPSLV